MSFLSSESYNFIGLNHAARAYLIVKTSAFCIAAELAPASPGEPATMPSTIVVATGIASTPLDLPYQTWTLSPKALEEVNPRSFIDTLREHPSVMLQRTGHGQGSPFLRGFTGFRTLMMIDGIRLNNSTFREGPNQYWNTIDPFSIDRLEAVYGPSSVLYGSDAIGGAINALTANPTPFAEDLNWHRRTLYRVSSAESSHIARVDSYAELGKYVYFQGGGSWKDFGDLRGGRSVKTQHETGYSERDYDAKLIYRPHENWNLSLNHQRVGQETVPRTHSTVNGLLWEGLRRGTDLRRELDQTRSLTYLQLRAQDLNSWIDSLEFSVSYQVQSEDENQLRPNLQRTQQGVEVKSFGVFLHASSQTDFGTWSYGVEHYRDWVDSYANRYKADGVFDRAEIQGPVGDESQYDLT